MPRIYPFASVGYPVPASGDLSSKIAPPYDVLDEGPKQALLKRDPHNIVAVDLPVTPPKTLGPDAAYAAAGDLYRRWLMDGVLKKRPKPALMVYEQVFRAQGKDLRRRGFFASVEAEEFGRKGGGIHRHEMTIKGGTDDRLKLMEATRAQLSPVFGVYQDADQAVAQWIEKICSDKPPITAVTGNDSVEHRLWPVEDPALIQSLQTIMHSRDVFIADGHHRYTTALNYRKAHPQASGAGGCLMVLVAAQDPGMIVLPTHRVLLGLKEFSAAKLEEAVKNFGGLVLEKTPDGAGKLEALAARLPSAGHHAVGLFDAATGSTWVLRTAEADPLAKLEPGRPEVWRRLDVAVLHGLVVDRVIRPAFGGEAVSYKYPHELKVMQELVEEAPGQRLGLVVQYTPLEQVIAVSLAGDVMPPKSTFFFPKLATGLVIQPLE